MKKNGKFGVIKLLFLCAIVAIVASVPSLVVAKKTQEGLRENLTNNTLAFEGVITVWNVDSFEGGSASKASFLESATLKFAKSNKGVYFLVKNLSVQEMTQNFMDGVYPDVISFGSGIGNIVKPVLEDLSSLDLSGVRTEVLESGKENGVLYAVGFLMGGMIVASTEEKLLVAGRDVNANLLELVNESGFDTETKKGTKHTASVVVGSNNYLSLTDGFSRVSGGRSLTDVYTSPSFYDAYLDFVSYNKGTLLLGTHRDLFKLSGRVAVGKISGVKIRYLEGYTNMVQYVGVVNGLSGDKQILAHRFVEFLLTDEVQKMTPQIGMINTIGKTYYESGEFKSLEETLNKPLNVEVLFS